MKDYLVREREVCRRLCIGAATLAQYVKAGTFPQPVRRKPNKAWRSSQVDRWIASMADQEIAQLSR